MKISVVIPTYKNTNKLLENLKHNFQYLKNCEIVVVNDCPKNPIKDKFFKDNNISLIENQKNHGFGGTMNIGIGNTKNEIVMLLNDDVLLKDTSFINTINIFNKNPSLFAVSFSQIEKNGSIVGKNFLYWKDGFIQHSRSENILAGKNGWAEGGSCIIDKNKFNLLGGFDENFSPFYWEDIDLSYRAKKNGFQILFDPKIQVVHHHETTIGSNFKKRYIKTIAYRNQLLCIWKNITDPKLRIEHLFGLIKRLAVSIVKFDLSFLLAFVYALIKLPAILTSKNNLAVISDYEILSISKK